MKILFIKSVTKVGHVGEVKEFADGYGQFLIKNGSGILATESTIKQNQKKVEEAVMKKNGEESFVKELAKKVSGLKIEMKGQANKNGGLYKSVHAKEVAEALTKKVIVGVSEHLLEEVNIKNTGMHKVNVIYKAKILGSFEVEVN
jgi:large subunit ribosomal protein L9